MAKGGKVKHKWKQFAEIIGAPYRKRFSSNGYGDFRIDNKGVYVYGEYSGYIDWDHDGSASISEMLDEEFKVENYKK